MPLPWASTSTSSSQSDLVATVGSAEDLKDVTETVQSLADPGQERGPSSAKRHLSDRPGTTGESSEWLLGLFASVIENSVIESIGQTVHLRSAAPVEMAEASRFLMAFLSGARADANRGTERQPPEADRPGVAQLPRGQQSLPPARALRREERQGAV